MIVKFLLQLCFFLGLIRIKRNPADIIDLERTISFDRHRSRRFIKLHSFQCNRSQRLLSQNRILVVFLPEEHEVGIVRPRSDAFEVHGVVDLVLLSNCLIKCKVVMALCPGVHVVLLE